MSTSALAPVWLYVVFGLVSLLFLLLGWSMTVSLAQGRPAALGDIAVLVLPTLLVTICAVLAVFALRKQSKGLAVLLTVIPLPAAFVLFGLIGAV